MPLVWALPPPDPNPRKNQNTNNNDNYNDAALAAATAADQGNGIRFKGMRSLYLLLFCLAERELLFRLAERERETAL